MYQQDDICAIASGFVQSAIAIIRISGSKIISKLETNFVFKNSSISLHTCKANYFYRADFIYENRIIDDIMLVVFRNPKSYTGEDMIEIYSHGSLFIQQEILKHLQLQTIRLAEPGEFTLRAYLNGKIDLTQAEAIHDIISSKNALSHSIAIHQLRGGIKNEIKDIRSNLLQLLTLLELELDFSEEDVEFASREKIEALLSNLVKRIEKLSYSFDYGNAIKNGVPVAIVGDTNVGKSTLMNALLNDERAIVSHIPGTTRDIIEDSFTYKGVTFRFSDTAGIRTSDDEIEQIGIELAKRKAQEAKLLLVLLNTDDNIDLLKEKVDFWKEIVKEDQHLIFVLNKMDKISSNELNQLLEQLTQWHSTVIPISAKLKMNIEWLLESLLKFVQQLNISGNEQVITNARQYNALHQSLNAAQRALEVLRMNYSNDLLAEELKMINNHLAQLIGEIPSNEVLNEIFSHFCIGK
ncbi:MAG TPA: tRNA uridine-5-carboxymethylaminomethyl(34) synthesis GTPase MnmE [Bacteroidales bacterium]|nr:tRNA uridine-5-carboxymethylaminomethyl(34) synthesis GTPase MnmE [Bacteroidales bacterium]HNV95761.1 tRNA uridine-5-carboxymethylaminomethyl(34) synthesis GTPase MnmE [Bacteroidales bacterium]